jgi:hypothetical protein
MSYSPRLMEPGAEVESFRDYSLKVGSRTLVLARKQYGPELLDRPLMLLRAKVASSYEARDAVACPRLGFVRGRSRYAIASDLLAHRLGMIKSSVQAINIVDRSILLGTGQEILYDQLIFAGRVTDLAKMLGLREYFPLTASAHFCVGRQQPPGTANLVVYDLRSESPVLRVVTTDESIWVAQLSQGAAKLRRSNSPLATHWRSGVEAAVSGLLETEDVRLLTDICTLRGAYPLEPLPTEYDEQLESKCKGAGIIRFGRFAEWRYSDLHELDWRRVA